MKRSDWKKHTATVSFNIQGVQGENNYRHIAVSLHDGSDGYNDLKLAWKGQAHDLNNKVSWPGEDPNKYIHIDAQQLEALPEEWRNTFDVIEVTNDYYDRENNPSRDPVFGHFYALECDIRYDGQMAGQVDRLADIVKARKALRAEHRYACEAWELVAVLKSLGVPVTIEAYARRRGLTEKPATTTRAYTIERWLGTPKVLEAKAAQAVEVAKHAAEEEKARNFRRGKRDASEGKDREVASWSDPDYQRGWCEQSAFEEDQPNPRMGLSENGSELDTATPPFD